VEPRTVPVEAWQAHVLKHPFGLGSLYNLPGSRGSRRWNSEGWDATDPVVLTEARRAELAAAIRRLDVDGRRCGADRLGHTEFRGDAGHRRMPCYTCPDPLVRACAEVTGGVAERYAAWVEKLLEPLGDAVTAERREVARRLFVAVRRPGTTLPVVFSTGLLHEGVEGARINAPNGVRVDFWRSRGQLAWRTTYRIPPADRAALVTFLLDVLPCPPGTPLSEGVLVPRPWWERSSP
jgi:hypothetical protein